MMQVESAGKVIKFADCQNEEKTAVPFHNFGFYESIPYPELTWNELHDSEGPFITEQNEKRYKMEDQDNELIDTRQKLMN